MLKHQSIILLAVTSEADQNESWRCLSSGVGCTQRDSSQGGMCQTDAYPCHVTLLSGAALCMRFGQDTARQILMS